MISRTLPMLCIAMSLLAGVVRTPLFHIHVVN